MNKQVPVDRASKAETRDQGSVHEVKPDLAYQRLGIVNVVYLGDPARGAPWVLVDAGVTGTTNLIVRAVDQRFGQGARPTAIIMTHGHFDHVGALEELAERWQVPIHAHPLEMPYLNGSASYPPPDPSIDGLMARLSPLYPRGPVDVGRYLQPLPEDGTVPGADGWRWIHTPGHTVGHISLWREADAAVIAGDAFITTNQESAYAVALQRPEIHGPPQYFTPDWSSARASVRRLAALEPTLAVTGHGRALEGPEMTRALQELADRFDEVAVPRGGRYAPTAEKERS